MPQDCPNCGTPVTAGHLTEPGIETLTPCGCRVATDGGSTQRDRDETGARSVDDTERSTVYVSDPPKRMFGNILIDGADGQCIYVYAGIEERCQREAVAHTYIDRGSDRKVVEMCAEHAREDVPEPPSMEQQELVTDGGVESSTNGPVDLTGNTENIGGKEPDGKPAAIGRWTFQTKKVRDTLLPHLEGDVLNAFAGKTRLSDYKRGITEVRNDLNPERDAEYQVDAADLGELFDDDSFDVVVLDPPFSQQQSDEHYDGLHARDMGAVRRAVAPLVKPGGCIVEFGWSLWGAADYFPGWDREEKLLFRRGIPDRQPVLMVVDRRNQSTLNTATNGGETTGPSTTETGRSGRAE